MRESRTHGTGGGRKVTRVPYREAAILLHCICRLTAVRPEGANHQWKRNQYDPQFHGRFPVRAENPTVSPTGREAVQRVCGGGG